MKVSRFGPKKRPDPSPEDEWLRQALLEAQEAELNATLQDAPPPYPHTAAYLRREKRQAKRTRREYRPRWQRFTQLAACLVLAVVLVAGGAVALEAAQREPVGIPSQDVTFSLSGTGSTEFTSSRFCPLTENGKFLHFSFTNTAQERATVIVVKEGWFHRISHPTRILVPPGETVAGSCALSNHAIYWFLVQSDMGGTVSGTLHAIQSDLEDLDDIE